MKCSLDKMRETFPGLDDSNVISLEGNPQSMEILQWVNAVNKRAQELGFKEGPIFNVKKVEPKDIFSFGYSIVEYNEEANDNYQEFLDHILLEENLYQDSYNDLGITGEDGKPFKFNQEKVGSEVLFAVIPGAPKQPRKPNFKDWKNKRTDLLSRLKIAKSKLIKQKASRDKLKAVNEIIEKLEHEIKVFEVTNASMAHASISEEISALNDLLKFISKPNTSPGLSISLIEDNMLQYRLGILDTILSNNDIYKGDSTNKELPKSLTKEELDSLVADFSNLKDQYENSLKKIMQKVILDNDYVIQMKESLTDGKLSQEDIKKNEERIEKFESRVKDLLDAKQNQSKIGLEGEDSIFNHQATFLGASSYDSILSEIIAITRDINNNKEIGITNIWKKQLKTSYDNLQKLTKDVNGTKEYFIDKLWQKDEFGIRTNKLINYVDPSFYASVVPKISKAKADFKKQAVNSTTQAKAYSIMMKKFKANTDFIMIHKTPEFAEAYKDNYEFEDFLIYSPQEMKDYEDEMKAKMGEAAYEIEKRKQRRQVENFLVDTFKNSADKYNKHPLRFLEHFYSQDFDQADNKSGGFLDPEFTYYIPKADKEDFYNQNFKNIANEGGKDFRDFYESSTALLEYTRESLVDENIQLNEVPDILDLTGREFLGQMTLFKKISTGLKEIISFLFNNDAFYVNKVENNPDDRSTIHSHYSSFGKRGKNVALRSILQNNLDTIISMAEQEGISVPDKYRIKEDKSLVGDAKEKQDQMISAAKYKIAEAIARKEINRKTSLDIYKRIMYATNIAESYNVRTATNSTINLVNAFAEKKGLINYQKYMKTWHGNNISQPGNLMDTQAGRLSAKEIRLNYFKKLSEEDKSIKEFLEKERKNLSDTKGLKEYDFTFNGKEYYLNIDEGTYYEAYKDPQTDILTENVLTVDQIADKYDEYLQAEIDKLGQYLTFGGLIGGFAWNMYRNLLMFKPKSGFNNRVQGYVQNNQAAASGLYDFGQDQLLIARRFLTGVGANRLLSYANAERFGPTNAVRRGQLDILNHLVENLKLLNNVATDYNAGEGGENSMTSALKEKISSFATDFSMNIPEEHNQLELLVAMMQHPKYALEDINGNLVPLFDPKTMTFPFDPMTMELLPRFRTPQNIANWEDFQPYEGKSPQDNLTQVYSLTRDKLHGNFRSNDKIAIQSNAIGKGATTFVKWFFENYDNQWGKKEVSVTQLEIDIRGRKRVLMERAPIMMTHLITSNIGVAMKGSAYLGLTTLGASAVAGTVGAAAVGTVAPFLLGASVITGVGFYTYQIVRNHDNIKLSSNDAKLALNYFMEIMTRTLKSMTMTYSRGRFNPIKDSYLENKTLNPELLEKFNLSERDRRIMSESAQEVADKFNITLGFIFAQVMMYGIIAMLKALSAGDDDEKERQIALMEFHEGNLKWLINMRNNLTADSDKFTNPVALGEQFTTSVLYDWMERTSVNFERTISKYDKGEFGTGIEGGLTFTKELAINASALAGIPAALTDPFKEDPNYFVSDRVFEKGGTTIIDDLFLGSNKSVDERYEDILKAKRKKVSNVLKDNMEYIIREKAQKDGVQLENVDKLVKKNIRKYLEAKGAYKGAGKKKRSAEFIIEKIDWDEIEDIGNYKPVLK